MNDDLELELERVAQAVGDGRVVDWEAETTTLPGLETLIGQLRLIEGVAAAHSAARGDASVTPPIVRHAGRDPVPSFVHLPKHTTEGRTSWGPLRILEPIGEGGFAEVFRAFDPTLRRDVALKLLRPDPRESDGTANRFLREARRLALVRHPNVVLVFGADRHDGRAGLWTEILTGRTLEQLLGDLGRFSAREAALIGIDVCRALAAVHARKLVHGDVKASNIMREEGGRIVLMDFGAATRLPGYTTSVLGESRPAGTPLTMAPEQLRNERATVASDVYGIGVLLYRLVSGRYPIEGGDLPALMQSHARGAFTPLRDVRPELADAFVQTVERALHPDAHQRFASAGAMERALLSDLAAVPTPAPPGGRWAAALQFLRERPALVGLTSVLIAAAVLTLVMVLRG